MDKYICSICGAVYNKETGDPKNNITAGTLWKNLPDSWICPICGSPQEYFNKVEKHEDVQAQQPDGSAHDKDLRELSAGELSALFSNLARGCEKQNLAEESTLFSELARYYQEKTMAETSAGIETLHSMVSTDVSTLYPKAEKSAADNADRGALRACTWGAKVSRIANSILNRYQKEGLAFIENNNVYVCEICGFIYIGQQKPDICPICKVPGLKIQELKRGA